MKNHLLNNTPEKYGEKYQSHYLEQYKLYVNGMELISNRRQKANSYFLTLNTLLLSAMGISFQLANDQAYDWMRIQLALLGILICAIFWFLLRSYKQLNSAKFEIIHEIERNLPLSLYECEWKILGEGKDSGKYYPFSHIELLIPWVFGLIYALLAGSFIIAAYV